jgi:hypothetical protein
MTFVLAIVGEAAVGGRVGPYEVCVGGSCSLELFVEEGAPAALGLVSILEFPEAYEGRCE